MERTFQRKHNLVSVIKTPYLRAMWGIGDAIFNIAIFNELIKKHTEIWVKTYYPHLYNHLPYVKRILQPGQGRFRFSTYCSTEAVEPAGLTMQHINYDPVSIKRYGTILAAQFASIGLPMPARPDFRLPISKEWDALAQQRMSQWDMKGKPLMMVRPIFLNEAWKAPSRAPDPRTFNQLYEAIREQFFCVSFGKVEDPTPGRISHYSRYQKEWILAPEPKVDVRLVEGELDFETLAALFKRATLVFGNPGLTPVLAQAVGTPNIIVYGGNESYRSVNCVGAHLAPTLPIEPDRPCDCHNRNHACDKRITFQPALEKLMTFVGENNKAKLRVLLFQTTWIDSEHREKLIRNGIKLHTSLNPDCDYLVVDSNSPRSSWKNGSHWINFQENIGHLSRGGRDGWGRAFCRGLEEAISGGYDYVVHIEGDSLFRLPVMDICREMNQKNQRRVMSIPVVGTKRVEEGWVETGLMFFNVQYLRDSSFIEKYDWQKRTAAPTPEKVIAGILGRDLSYQHWKGLRGDKNQITVDTLESLDLDWITHCWDNDDVYNKFVELNMPKVTDKGGAHRAEQGKPATGKPEPVQSMQVYTDKPQPKESATLKVNFGCGTNKIPGWNNHDKDVDITKRLPYADNSVSFIFAEHCIEHVSYYEAVNFLKECVRILKPGGMIRISVPSIENLVLADPNSDVIKRYVEFVHSRGWAPTKDISGAIHGLLFQHGHRAPWTLSLLKSTLVYVRFKSVEGGFKPGISSVPEFMGVEGHGKVIGEDFNALESAIAEGTVDK
jgi:SAM-dependent methyltransferase